MRNQGKCASAHSTAEKVQPRKAGRTRIQPERARASTIRHTDPTAAPGSLIAEVVAGILWDAAAQGGVSFINRHHRIAVANKIAVGLASLKKDLTTLAEQPDYRAQRDALARMLRKVLEAGGGGTRALAEAFNVVEGEALGLLAEIFGPEPSLAASVKLPYKPASFTEKKLKKVVAACRFGNSEPEYYSCKTNPCILCPGALIVGDASPTIRERPREENIPIQASRRKDAPPKRKV